MALSRPLFIAVFVAGAAHATEANAEAEAPPMTWTRAPGAESCIDAEALVKAASAQLGRDVVIASEGQQPRVRGVVAPRAPRGYRVVLELLDVHGAVQGKRELSTREAGCHALDRELSFIVSLLLEAEDSGDAVTPPPEPPRSPPPAPPAAPRELAPSRPSPRDEPEPGEDPDDHGSHDGPEVARPRRVRLTAGAVGSLGRLPGLAAGFSGRARVSLPRVPDFEIGLSLWPARTGQSASSAFLQAQVSLYDALVDACPLTGRFPRLEIAACAGVEAGAVLASGSSARALGTAFPVNQSARRAYFGPFSGGRVAAQIVGPTVLFVAADLTVPTPPYSFSYRVSGGAPLRVFSMAPVIGTIEIALGVHFL